MTRADIFSELTPVFRDVFNQPGLILTEDLTANDVDNWDSLSHMVMITEVEQRFNIKFKLRDINKMRNVGDLVTILSERIA